MTVQVSSKFKELILGASSFASIFNGGRILIYSGAQPPSADNPIQGSLLAQITNEGQAWVPNGSAAGLNFTLSGVWAANDPTQAWRLKGSGTGGAGWFRLVGKSIDNGDYSLAAPRIDGTIGTGGAADMKLVTTAMTPTLDLPIQQFLFSFPPILGA